MRIAINALAVRGWGDISAAYTKRAVCRRGQARVLGDPRVSSASPPEVTPSSGARGGVRQRTAAGVVPFVKEHGYLRGYTLPTVKGLFAHERISLGAVLHEYLANWRFVTLVEGLPGTVFVPG